MRAAQDLAAVGFGSVQSAAVQLGKALEDPEQGLSALRRVGVSFSESQRDLIKTLVDTGQTLEAQQVILRAVEQQVGGAGAAQASGLSGAVHRLSEAWEELARERRQTAWNRSSSWLAASPGPHWPRKTVLEASQQLLTFRSIAGETFDRTLVARRTWRRSVRLGAERRSSSARRWRIRSRG